MIRVVLCTYNGEKYLKEQLDSILNQTIKDWKICAYDDQSNDSTIEILEKYKREYPDIIDIHVNIKQYGAKYNFLHGAAEQSKTMTDSDYLMFCDQDDVWDSDKMEVSLKEMKRMVENYGNQMPLLVCGDSCVVDENLNMISDSLMKYNNYNTTHLGLSYELMENKIQGCTAMINVALAKMLQKLPQHVSMHDAWMGILATSMGQVSFIRRSVLKYRRWEASVSGIEDYKAINRNKIGHLREQKYIVYDCVPTVEEALLLFGDLIPKYNRRIMEAFCTLPQQNWINRRFSIIRYRMWKTGFLRNLGLLILL